MLTKPALAYTGGGFGGALPEIPARDLSDDEVERYGGEAALIASGLYVKGADNKKAAGPKENKAKAADAPPDASNTPAVEAAKEV